MKLTEVFILITLIYYNANVLLSAAPPSLLCESVVRILMAAAPEEFNRQQITTKSFTMERKTCNKESVTCTRINVNAALNQLRT